LKSGKSTRKIARLVHVGGALGADPFPTPDPFRTPHLLFE
jgi:hypothetical protein